MLTRSHLLVLLLTVGGTPLSQAYGAADIGATFHTLLQAGELAKAQTLLEGLAGPEARLTRFRGLLALKREQFPKAEKSFRRVLKLKPQWLSTWMVLAQVQLALKRPGDALDSLKRCASLGKDRPGYYRLKARAHLAAQQAAKAFKTLQAGRTRFPESVDLKLDTVLILTTTGLHHRAVRELQDLVSREPLSSQHLRVAGSILTRIRKTPGALPLLERLLHRYPATATLYSHAGFSYAKEGNHLWAGRFFARAASLGEDTAFEAADQFRLLGQVQQALQWNAQVTSTSRLLPQRLTIYLEAESYHQATSLEPLLRRAGLLDAPTRFQLGYAWIKAGQIDRANALLNKMPPSPSRTSFKTMITQAEEFRFQG